MTIRRAAVCVEGDCVNQHPQAPVIRSSQIQNELFVGNKAPSRLQCSAMDMAHTMPVGPPYVLTPVDSVMPS